VSAIVGHSASSSLFAAFGVFPSPAWEKE